MVTESITYLIKNAVGIYLILTILARLLKYEVKIKKESLCIFSVLSLAAAVIPFYALKDISLARDIADFSTFLVFVAIPYCVLKYKKKLSFFWFGFILNSVFDLIVTLVTVAVNNESHIINNLTYIALTGICLLFVFYLNRKNFTASTDFFEKIPMIIYIAVFVASLSSYYSVMVPVNSDYSESASRVLLIASAIIVIICIAYIGAKYLSVVMKQHEEIAQLDMQVRHYEALSEKNLHLKRFRHDLANNLFALSALLNNGNYEEAKKYLSEMDTEIRKTENRFSTGNILADAILSKKYEDASASGIGITFFGSIPSDKIANSDLCAVLSNSLDNAIRGCANIAPCVIDVEALSNKNGFSLTVSNPVKYDIEIKNNTVKTTKKDKESHGFGISSIKKTAEKYGGEILLSCENKRFTIKVIILYSD